MTGKTSPEASYTGGINDGARALLFHHRCCVFHPEKYAPQKHSHGYIESFDWYLFNHPCHTTDACIIEYAIYASEFF